MTQQKYDRQGLLALDPRAFLGMFFEPPPKPVNTVCDGVEIVAISGPLDHHAGDWCDSYDAILERFDAAFSGAASTVVMKINSPGGLVSGCFETARAIRAKARASGKSLVCYVDGQAGSAAYALAAAADRIVASETSIVGSIGIIDTRIDATAMDAAQGLKYAFVTSGSRKADGNIHQGLSTAELIDKQGVVNALANVFFSLVSDMRGFDPAPLEARQFVGLDAKANGLVDEILPFSDLLASLASAATTGAVMSKYAEARAALAEAAKGDDEEAKKAQRALAAMDGDEEGDEEEESASSEGDDDEKKKKDEEEAAATAAKATVSASTAGALASTVSTQDARLALLEQRQEASDRAAIFASRPDLAPSLVKALGSSPLADVRRIVDATPKPKVPAAAASAVVQATVGAGQGDGNAPRLATAEKAALDAQMGLSTVQSIGVSRTPHTQVLGAPVVVTGKKV